MTEPSNKAIKITSGEITYQVLLDGNPRTRSGKSKLCKIDNNFNTADDDAIQSTTTTFTPIKKEGSSTSEPQIYTSGGVIETEKEEIITEINSNDFPVVEDFKKRHKSKKSYSSDHLYESDELSPKKIIKIKKEKCDKDGNVLLPCRKRFNRSWFYIPEFSRWLEESPIPGFAFCNICRKDLQPGKSELMKHALTAKHKKKIEAVGTGTKDDPLDRRIIDLRSDTTTVPSRDMRDHIRDSVVGATAYGEDTVMEDLENKIAHMMGMEAGLFLPSGTMANLIGVLAHCWSRGSLAILGDKSFLYRSAQGSLSELGGVSSRVVTNLPDGTFELDELRNILCMHNKNWPAFTLVCIENTHTHCGGKVLPLQWMESLGDLCDEFGIPIHLDGARLINASVALASSPSKLAKRCTSATFCLNKGLGAPGGSILTGSFQFIERASVLRKSFGGFIHQGGILATAGLYAVEKHAHRIAKDHSNAIALGKAVCNTNSSAVVVDVSSIQTNIVHLVCDNIRVRPEQMCTRLQKVGENEAFEISGGIIVKCLPIEPNIVRMVTHGDLTQEDVRAIIRKLQFVINEYDNMYVVLV